jgi:hypothetical protein
MLTISYSLWCFHYVCTFTNAFYPCVEKSYCAGLARIQTHSTPFFWKTASIELRRIEIAETHMQGPSKNKAPHWLVNTVCPQSVIPVCHHSLSLQSAITVCHYSHYSLSLQSVTTVCHYSLSLQSVTTVTTVCHYSHYSLSLQSVITVCHYSHYSLWVVESRTRVAHPFLWCLQASAVHLKTWMLGNLGSVQKEEGRLACTCRAR